MPFPYEPILRHDPPSMGVYLCPGCRAQMLTQPCGIAECFCACNGPAILSIPPKVETTDEFPEFAHMVTHIPGEPDVETTVGIDLPHHTPEEAVADVEDYSDDDTVSAALLAGAIVGGTGGAIAFGEGLPVLLRVSTLLLAGIVLIFIGIRLRSDRA